MSLTDEGESFATKGQLLIREFKCFQEELLSHKHAIYGDIRVVSPLGFGMKHIGPIIAEFQNLHPRVNIELTLSDNPRWSTHDCPDIMFYIGYLRDSSLKRIVLAKNKRLLVASPEYLQASPKIVKPEDLEKHRCIALRENDEDATMWRLRDTAKGLIKSIRISPVLSCNVSKVIMDWCKQGQGIVMRSEWDVKKVVFRNLCHFSKIYKTEMTHDQRFQY